METVTYHVTFLVFLTQYMICGHDTTVKNIIAERIIWQLIYFICISTFMQRQFGIRNFFIFCLLYRAFRRRQITSLSKAIFYSNT